LEEADKWAEEEEKREAAEATTAGKVEPSTGEAPEDLAWMEEQLGRERELHGDTFGSDIVEEF